MNKRNVRIIRRHLVLDPYFYFTRDLNNKFGYENIDYHGRPIQIRNHRDDRRTVRIQQRMDKIAEPHKLE